MKKILLAVLPLLVARYAYAQVYTDTVTKFTGIGTSTPGAKLEIVETGTHFFLDNAQLSANRNPLTGAVTDAAKGAAVLVMSPNPNGGNFQFYTGSTIGGSVLERMRITETGSVGIGVTSPDQKLQVDGNIHMNDKLYFGNWWLGATGGFPSNPGFIYAGGDETFGFASSGGQISIAIDGAFRQVESGKVNYFMDKVGIGTTQPDKALTVNGSIHATEVLVDQNVRTPDYVFDKDYDLTSLKDVKTYIDQNHHLPEIPSAGQVAKEGINLGEMNAKLLKKIEELTLYLIEKDKQDQKKESQLRSQQARLNRLEKQLKAIKTSNH